MNAFLVGKKLSDSNVHVFCEIMILRVLTFSSFFLCCLRIGRPAALDSDASPSPDEISDEEPVDDQVIELSQFHSNCGRMFSPSRIRRARIVGGTSSPPNEWPWMVSFD